MAFFKWAVRQWNRDLGDMDRKDKSWSIARLLEEKERQEIGQEADFVMAWCTYLKSENAVATVIVFGTR
jgi:hypothetical protein